ncbi:hypothetical protein J4433_02870 [Candidatus Pacearchaeota archaeon]|nr:hypothetical protein [Candidatus Pacearchaeota archaeon]
MAKVDDILKKYGSKIESEILTEKNLEYSREYKQFKEEAMPTLTRFERLCKNIGSMIKIRVKKSDEERINKNLQAAHLDITAGDVMAFSTIILVLGLFISVVTLIGIYLATQSFSFIAFFLFFFSSLFLFYFAVTAPDRIAESWRLKASSQMVPAILYVVVYMRHTSNLERAVKFASEHLQPPLALDFKKIFWDVEVGKYSTLKESLDAYLETWRGYSTEFIEAFHLIESSLYEPSETSRTATLEKSLDVILNGVYERMLKFTHNVKTPLTNLYMLGIVLPTLALALLPLASTLLQGAIRWHHVMILFNLIIPFFVFYLTSGVLSKRPGGYGETELLEQNPDYYIYASKQPYLIALFVLLPMLFIGFLPLLFQYTSLPEILGLEKDFTIALFGNIKFFDFKQAAGATTGPFGIGAALLSLLIPLGIALFFSTAYGLKTSQLVKTRIETKELEQEFASSLFQLGNRLGDGIPAEIAFGRVAESVRGTKTENFFKTVNANIHQVGMSLENAIFNQRRGAIIYYPSELVKTSMQIMMEAVKKGLQVAARALMSISQYIKNINKINERLQDLLADIVSDMRSNMTFLAPVLAGIVTGLAVMITTILSKLELMLSMQGTEGMAGIETAAQLTSMFNVTTMIPPYFLQIIVGIYIIEIIFILTGTLVKVESGVDTLSEKAQIAKNLKIGVILYALVALISITALSLLASVATGGLA